MATVIKIDTPALSGQGELSLREPFIKVEVEGGKKYRKWRLSLNIIQPPKVPVCDVHLTFEKKPKIWDSEEPNPKDPNANQVKLEDFPPDWDSSYDEKTGVLKLEAKDCDTNKLRKALYSFSFLVEDQKTPVALGKVKVQLTDKAHTVILESDPKNEKELAPAGG